MVRVLMMTDVIRHAHGGEKVKDSCGCGSQKEEDDNSKLVAGSCLSKRPVCDFKGQGL